MSDTNINPLDSQQPAIQSIPVIRFESLEQFVNDINNALAIIQNSPLYKGVAGNEGADGETGLRGMRGIKFFFVNLQRFQTQFPNELSLASDITMNYINSKVTNFESKQKLLIALDTTEIVDKDVIVLHNSVMISYSVYSEVFEVTGQSFNPQDTALLNINETIDNYVKQYIDNNPIINSLENNISRYATLAKNYADNNSGFVTNELLATSVYSPYIAGFNNRIGIDIPEHKYYGYADNNFGLANKGTMVLGSMRRYYQLLMNTITTTGSETLSSDYATGVDNIPSLIMLQDTYNNGLYFGHKDRNNLKRFGSIFKNENHDLVIKSDSSKLASEYSQLLINRQYMKFDKLVQFGDSLEVSRNLHVFSDINNKHIRTGKFTTGANTANNFNNEKVEFGSRSVGSIALNVAEFEEYTNYLGRVLITDSNGRVSKDYALETMTLNQADLLNLNQIRTPFPISNKNVLTSNYFGFLASKFNNLTQYASDNYWRKNQFNTGEIPAIRLGTSLTVDKFVTIGTIFNADVEQSLLHIGASKVVSDSSIVEYTRFKDKVFVTNSDGRVMTEYEILTQEIKPTITPANATNYNLSLVADNAQYKVVTAKYLNAMIEYTNDIKNRLINDYWSRVQFTTGEIPSISLDNGFTLGKTSSTQQTFIVRNVNGVVMSIIRATNDTNTTIKLGHNSNLIFEGDNIQYSKFKSRVLVTDANGNLSKNYYLHNVEFVATNPVITNPNGGTYTDVVFTPDVTITQDHLDNGIPNFKTINSIMNALRSLKTWIGGNFWRKDQYPTFEIPSIHVSNTIKSKGDVSFGEQQNPNFHTVGDVNYVGKTNIGVTRFRKHDIYFEEKPTKLIGTDENGKVIDYTPVSSEPTSSNPTTTTTDLGNRVFNNFWRKDIADQTFQNFPTKSTEIVTGNLFHWLIANLYAIRGLIYDRPTYADMNNYLIPTGMIMLREYNNMDELKSGWYLCDGRVINNAKLTNYQLPNLGDRFPKMVTNPAHVFWGGSNTRTLGLTNIPPHDHYQHSDSNGDKNQPLLVQLGITAQKQFNGDRGWSRNGGWGDGWIFTTSKTGGSNGVTQPFDNQPAYRGFYPYIKVY